MTQASDSPAAIFGRFLRFGLLAWGGPVAQIAMVRREIVDEQSWISPSRFNRLLAVYQVLPGPEAHELCVHLGMIRGGRLGGLLAGLGFMLPGLVLMLALAWAYDSIDLGGPTVGALFLGLQIAVVALIVRAVHRIGEHVLVSRWLWAIAAVSGVVSLLGLSFWIVLAAAALTYALAAARHHAVAAAVLIGLILLGAGIGEGFTLGEAAASVPEQRDGADAGLLALFLAGLKAGLLTFGGAYTAIPFVRDDAVGNGWISEAQFLDGLALSGIIPAPFIIFAAFVGYVAGGFAGGLAMTAGIFLPAFAFGLLFHEHLEGAVANAKLHRLLEGVAAGVVGLIAATTLELGASLAERTPSLPWAGLIFAASLALLYLWNSKLNILAVLPLAALAGWLAFG